MDFKNKTETKMKDRLAKLKDELARMRTGRASPVLLDGVKVESYGQQMALKQLGAVTAPDARTLEVRPWDPKTCSDIEKALNKADLGAMAKNDGQVVRVSLPAMNEDRRKDLVRLVSKLAEEYRVAVRNERRDAMEEIKKAAKDKQISEDERKTHEGLIQKLTDAYIKQVDEIAAGKQKEITTI